jgi:hypothetical protein
VDLVRAVGARTDADVVIFAHREYGAAPPGSVLRPGVLKRPREVCEFASVKAPEAGG